MGDESNIVHEPSTTGIHCTSSQITVYQWYIKTNSIDARFFVQQKTIIENH